MKTFKEHMLNKTMDMYTLYPVKKFNPQWEKVGFTAGNSLWKTGATMRTLFPKFAIGCSHLTGNSPEGDIMAVGSDEIVNYAIVVRFRKNINEIYVDLDENDYEEYELKISEEQFYELQDQAIKKKALLPFTSLQINFNSPDFKRKSFYGSFVLDIKPNEIISIKKQKFDGVID